MPQIDESRSIEFYNSRPGIRIDGSVLIFNHQGSLLVVKPNYRNTWAWPGGGSEQGESPMTVAIRECREEIGLCPTPLRPAFANYIPPRPDGSRDAIHFVFTADPVMDEFVNQITLQHEELDDAKFVPIARLGAYMKEYRVRAVQTYLKNKIDSAMVYLEDGLIP
jgi:8-oxo-dGTP pyrophosphatase MutT (NUDIX family)